MNPPPESNSQSWNICRHCKKIEQGLKTEFKTKHEKCDPIQYPTIANRFTAIKQLFSEHLAIDPYAIEVQTSKYHTKLVFTFKESKDP